MFYRLWLKRIVFSPADVFQVTSLFSIIGLILGVAVLTVALLTVNGFSRSLQKVIVDRNGHLVFLSEEKQPLENFLNKLEIYQSSIRQAVPFLSFTGLASGSGELKGVVFEGLDFSSFTSDLTVQARIIRGQIDLKNSHSFVILGRSLAEDLKVNVGDSIQAVFVESSGQMDLSRKKKSFSVDGIADLGKHDLNSRLVLMPLSTGQQLMGRGDQVSGLRIWLKEDSQTKPIVRTLNYQYGDSGYQAASWMDMERSFFNNINSDKQIIFFVLLILIIAAGFNVSSALFVQVFKRTREISILKALGAGNSVILRIFLLRGLALGLSGAFLGLVLGLIIFRALLFFQQKWRFLPSEVYQVSEIVLHWKTWDLAIIFFSALFVVLLASILPARRACHIPIKKGLTYE